MSSHKDSLVRIDDGQVFTRNSDGTYSMSGSVMQPPYRYKRAALSSSHFRPVTEDEIKRGRVFVPEQPQYANDGHGGLKKTRNQPSYRRTLS